MAGPAQMVEHTSYPPHTQAELVDLTNQFHHLPGELLALWLSCLRDLGVDCIKCTDDEMEKLAAVMTHRSRSRRMQNSRRYRRVQGSLLLLEWVTAAVRTVWVNAGDVPDTVSKWRSFEDSVRILQELGMRQAMFNPNTQGPEDEFHQQGCRISCSSTLLPPVSDRSR